MDGGAFSFIDGNMVLGVMLPLVAVMVFMVHEAGHYVVARLCRVHVESVTVGLGRDVWSRTDSRGTLWTVRIFPVCGFVHIAQKKEGDGGNRSGVYCYQPLWKRFLIVLAGPVANIVLAFLMTTFFYIAAGWPSVPPFVTGVEIGSPAEEAGFRVGDEIVALDGKPVFRFDSVWEVAQRAAGKRFPIAVRRGGEILNMQPVVQEVSYTDDRGFKRRHGRIGLLGMHQPMDIDAVASVNGLDCANDTGRARRLLLERMGRDIVIGTDSVDGKVHNYTVNLSAELNKGLADPGSRDYEHIYLGRTAQNFYLPVSLAGGVGAGLRDTARLAAGIVGVAGRFGKIDRRMIEPETQVAREVSVWKYSLFVAFYAGVILSLSTAIMNILPVPGFDGGLMLRHVIEAFVGPERADVIGPYAVRIALITLVGVLSFINRDVLALFMK